MHRGKVFAPMPITIRQGSAARRVSASVTVRQGWHSAGGAGETGFPRCTEPGAVWAGGAPGGDWGRKKRVRGEGPTANEGDNSLHCSPTITLISDKEWDWRRQGTEASSPERHGDAGVVYDVGERTAKGTGPAGGGGEGQVWLSLHRCSGLRETSASGRGGWPK
ncbi:MAG: hypothetical protein BJ554DRAFT_1948 [Olpidium bornovanus]|uniref:Uncharacterized protein n=1 Tax=Olpidium bornovanus TaxID=278681 RepID=A0A8H8DGP9_9FUNG|nr:MAG: hypothetical protein BJ554DRAFT_1948 [Olpidium bornovanus]